MTSVNYKVETVNRGDSIIHVKSKSGEMIVDLDGKIALTPLEVFLSSLAACLSFYIKKFAKSANIQMDLFKIEIDSDLVLDNGYKFKNINVSIDTNGAVLDDAKKNSLIQFVKNCPVHNTLRSQPEIDIKII